MDGQSIRVCTGTGDKQQARAIAEAMQADADVGRFASKTAPTDAQTLALIDAIDQAAQRRRSKFSSETPAGKGQPVVRKSGF